METKYNNALGVEEVKGFLRIDNDLEDSIIETLVTVALMHVEAELGYQFDADEATGDLVIPEPLKHAAVLLVSMWYDYRGEITEDNIKPIPVGFKQLLLPFKRWHV